MGDALGSPVVEWQMLVKDPEAAAAFYSGLFGWSVNADNALGYRRVSTGGAFNGGIWPSPPEGHNLVQLFIGVSSVSESHRCAEQMGARTIVPPQKLPDGDELAIMLDPQGLPFGIVRKP
jgi:predicted enzyme related to lactoylglutathione lyase